MGAERESVGREGGGAVDASAGSCPPPAICGALCFDGAICCATPVGTNPNTGRPTPRCALHGGRSTGAKTPAGKARQAAARWPNRQPSPGADAAAGDAAPDPEVTPTKPPAAPIRRRARKDPTDE